MWTIKKQRLFPPARPESGYSLIEIAISMMIVGVLLAGGASAYNVYKKDQVITVTSRNVASMTEAINSYRALYGTYPCPAPIDAPRNSPNYGKPDCATATAPGTCSNGICIQRSPDPLKGNVRIGALPFRILNIDDEETYDGYGSRLYYAVTENLTVLATYKETGGGIDLINDSGVSVVNPAASIRYLIFSTGANQAGGYSRDGVEIQPCIPSQKDGSNCDFNQVDAVFRTARPTTVDNNNHFDDIIQPYIKSEPPLWKRTETNPDNIEDLSPQNIGISVQTPGSDLVVSGNVVSRTDGSALGNLLTTRLCSTGGTNCFEPKNISGDISTGTPGNGPSGPNPVAGDGMKCDSPYEYMVGIKNAGPDCAPVVTKCPSPKVVQGVDAAGNLICSDVLSGCTSKNITVCGMFITLPASASGVSIGTHTGYPGAVTGTPTVGINRAYRFTCNNGLWHDDITNAPGPINYYFLHDSNPSSYPWVGDCTCTPSVTSVGGISCGLGYTGTYTSTTTTTCAPFVVRTVTSNFSTACTCAGNAGNNFTACVAPRTGPGITTPWTQTCVGNVLQPKVFGVSTGSCTCTVLPDIPRSVACPVNFVTGSKTYNKPFNTTTCAYDPEVLVSDPCVCASDTRTTHPPRTDCPACSAGDRDLVMSRGGPLCNFTIVDSDTPNACIPQSFTWQTVSTLLYSAPFVAVPTAGSSCACGAPSPQNCKIRLGSTDYVYSCSCQPH